MIKELKYTGYAASPSDYECPDGDLAVAMNLVQEKGSLRPVAKPETVLNLNSVSRKVVCIHTGAFGAHYIVYDTSSCYFYWLDSASSPGLATSYNPMAKITSYKKVSVIGNVVVILTHEGMQFFQWNIANYVALGALPELTLQFGLHGMTRKGPYRHDIELSGSYRKNSVGHYEPLKPIDLNEDDVRALTVGLLAQANKAVAEVHEAGHFIFPFFVRYAFRLYDGSTVRPSAPVLMVPSALAPFIPTTYDGDFHFYAYGATLDFQAVISSELLALKRWKDIVTSVDIFISAPIYTYDQSGECRRLMPLSLYTAENGYFSLNGHVFSENENMPGTAAYELPQFDEDVLVDKFCNVANFYFYHSIPVEELTTEMTPIDAKEGYMAALLTRETLSDDYDSHDSYLARGAMEYNARLNLFGVSKKKFDGFHPSCCFARTDAATEQVWVESGYWTSDYEEGRGEDTRPYWVDTSHYETKYTNSYYVVDCFVHIKTDGYETVVRRGASDNVIYGHGGTPRWFFYPDVKAYKAVLVVRYVPDENDANVQEPLYSVVTVHELMLTEHQTLNGAYWFDKLHAPASVYRMQYDVRTESFDVDELNANMDIPGSCKPFAEANTILPVLNKIYTSDVNNPFNYAVTNINTIGSGEIIGISSVAKALSQGQFGQFPLYAFTTDGVWALEVSNTGTYSAKQPITRDVCINPDSITPIDSSVLFATERGIMLLSGSEAVCITDGIDNDEEPFALSCLPFSAEIKKLADLDESALCDELPFSEFLSGCRMLYAYNRQMIVAFNPSCRYAYVYSLESKSWGMVESSVASRVDSYPEAYAMTSDGELVDWSQEIYVDSGQLLVTRPLKLDMPNTLKTIDTIIQRGHFRNGHVRTVLYGSRDLKEWLPVYTSRDHYLRGFRGTPYKFFRIALICSLSHDESLYGATVQYLPRLVNQPR